MPLVDTLPLRPGSARWDVWSTTARIAVTRPAALAEAETLTRSVLADVDAACSRFRPDSELRATQGGGEHRISALLADLVEAALTAARRTGGAVDPTVGGWLCDLGYDRDFADLVDAAGPARIVLHPGPHWSQVRLTRGPDGDRLATPAGVRLDLGATAKAYAADRCAELVAAVLDTGVLVSLGGDIATAGPAPAGGWRVLVQDRPADPACTVHLPAGAGLATSSTVSRRWLHHGAPVHHIVDPRTGQPASTRWRTATVAAADCVQANSASTAALVHGDDGPGWLRRTGLPARLVDRDARVWTVGAWPAAAGSTVDPTADSTVDSEEPR